MSYRHNLYHKNRERVLPKSLQFNYANLNNGNDADLSNEDNSDNDLQPQADVPPAMDALLRNFKENLCSFIQKK